LEHINEVDEQGFPSISAQDRYSICHSDNKQSAADEYDDVSEVMIQNRPRPHMEDQASKLKNFDEMLNESGGIGSFHILAMIFIIVALNFCSMLLHSLPYLLMYPDYICYEK
jgi:hypothetical protein